MQKKTSWNNGVAFGSLSDEICFGLFGSAVLATANWQQIDISIASFIFTVNTPVKN